MTIEQLEKGNKVMQELKGLKDFQHALNEPYRNSIMACEYNKTIYLELSKYPELTKIIQDYVSEQIKKLEKQLKEI